MPTSRSKGCMAGWAYELYYSSSGGLEALLLSAPPTTPRYLTSSAPLHSARCPAACPHSRPLPLPLPSPPLPSFTGCFAQPKSGRDTVAGTWYVLQFSLGLTYLAAARSIPGCGICRSYRHMPLVRAAYYAARTGIRPPGELALTGYFSGLLRQTLPNTARSSLSKDLRMCADRCVCVHARACCVSVCAWVRVWMCAANPSCPDYTDCASCQTAPTPPSPEGFLGTDACNWNATGFTSGHKCEPTSQCSPALLFWRLAA